MRKASLYIAILTLVLAAAVTPLLLHASQPHVGAAVPASPSAQICGNASLLSGTYSPRQAL